MTAWGNRLKSQDRRYYDVAHTKSTDAALKVCAHMAIFAKNPTLSQKSWPHRAIR